MEVNQTRVLFAERARCRRKDRHRTLNRAPNGVCVLARVRHDHRPRSAEPGGRNSLSFAAGVASLAKRGNFNVSETRARTRGIVRGRTARYVAASEAQLQAGRIAVAHDLSERRRLPERNQRDPGRLQDRAGLVFGGAAGASSVLRQAPALRRVTRMRKRASASRPLLRTLKV